MNAKGMVCIGLAVLAMSLTARGLEVLDSNYRVQEYLSVEGKYTHALELDTAGNIYLTLSEEDIVVRVGAGGSAAYAMEGAYWPIKAVWAVGSEYGEYLYVTSNRGPTEGVVRLTADGTASQFASIGAVDALALDRTGWYGHKMYVGRNVGDQIDAVEPNGTVERFSGFPYNMRGCVEAIAFDPTGLYEGLMYVATSSAHGVEPRWSGLHSLDPNGNPTRFAGEIVSAYELAFDTVGFFGGELFVVGTRDFEVGSILWRVGPDGKAREFARPTGQGVCGLTMTFASDGTMLVAESVTEKRTIVVSRVIPTKRY